MGQAAPVWQSLLITLFITFVAPFAIVLPAVFITDVAVFVTVFIIDPKKPPPLTVGGAMLIVTGGIGSGIRRYWILLGKIGGGELIEGNGILG